MPILRKNPDTRKKNVNRKKYTQTEQTFVPCGNRTLSEHLQPLRHTVQYAGSFVFNIPTFLNFSIKGSRYSLLTIIFGEKRVKRSLNNDLDSFQNANSLVKIFMEIVVLSKER